MPFTLPQVAHSRRSQTALEMLQFRGRIRVLRPLALENAGEGVRCRVPQFGAPAGVVDAPVRDQLMLEKLVFTAVDDGIKDHGADGELLHPGPGQPGCGVALGKAAAQIGRRVRARDVVEQVDDVVGFHQMLIDCHSVAFLLWYENIGIMTRICLLLLLASPFLSASRAVALPRVERGNLIFDNIPEPAAGLSEKLDAYLNARQATPLGFSPKGQLLITTRFGDVEQLHLVERPGGERRQLTFLRDPITQAAFSPDPGRSAYVYLKDVGGNENAQLYYQRLGEPTAKLLTDGKSLNGGPVWSNAGREVAFFSTARDGVSYDIDVVEPESGSLPRLVVTGDDAAWYPLDWSPDDRKLLVLKYLSISEAYLYVVDLASGQKREVESAPTKVGIAGAKFSRDGQGVYLISDLDGEFAQLRYVNLFTGDKTVISGRLSWDIEELAISRDGHYLAYISNEAGIDKLNVLDLRTHQDLIPPKLPAAGIIGSLSFNGEGNRIAFGVAAPNRPRDAYVLDIATNHLEAWTHSEAGAGDLANFVAPRVTQFPP